MSCSKRASLPWTRAKKCRSSSSRWATREPILSSCIACPSACLSNNMALLPHNPRDQRLLIVTLLAVGLGAVYQQLIWTPKNQELNALATRLDTLDTLNRVAKAEVAKGSGTKMKQEADELARELRMLRGIVPTENEVPQLLESVSTAARHAGLEISDVAPDGILKGEQYDTYKYKIGVTGPYHQVSRLLTNIGTLRRIVAPINVTLLPSSRSNAETKARKGDQLLEAKFGIQAYVAFTSVKHAATNAASATNTHIEAEHPGAQPSSIARELYAYTRDGRRDPFYSLL